MADFKSTVYNLARSRHDLTLTLTQLAVLMKVADGKRPEARKFAVIATFLAIPKSTTSRAVSKLTGMGLIARVTDSADQRTCWFDLTEKGVEFTKHIAAGAKVEE